MKDSLLDQILARKGKQFPREDTKNVVSEDQQAKPARKQVLCSRTKHLETRLT